MTFTKFMRCASVAALLTLTPVFIPQLSQLISAQAAEVDPINIYAQLERTRSVRVSPDGKYVAMLSPFQGSKAVFIYDLENPNAKTKIIPTPDKSIVKAIDWASDKHVIMLARIRGKMRQGKMKNRSVLFSRWISTNVETEKSVIMFDDKIKDIGRPSPYGGNIVHDLTNDPDNVLMSFSEYVGKSVTRHYKVDLDSGDERLYISLPSDSGRVVRSVDGSKILAREDYDRRSGEYRVFVGEYPDEKEVYSQKFDTDKNRTMFLLTVYDGKPLLQETEKDKLTLFTVNPISKVRLPFNLNASVPSGYEYSPKFDNFTRELIGITYTDDIYREVYSAEPYKNWHVKAKSALNKDNVIILSRTEDNSSVTLFSEGPDDPGTYYLFEPNEGRISPLGGTYPELKPSQIGKTVRADFTARDGVKIPAYLTYPPGKSSASGMLPLVTMPHGGPLGVRDDASFDFWAQYISSLGYVVFKPQFRGSGGFGYEFEKKGYGQFGGAMLDDTIDGVKNLIATGVADPDKICVTGASYGGYQAMELPVMEPDLFKCSVAVSGVADIPQMLKFVADLSGTNSSSIKFWNRVIGDYYDDRDKMKEQSPALSADKIKAEMILVHGTDDMTVPLEQSEIMGKALKKIGQSDDVIMLKNDDHNLSLPQSRLKLLQASEELFAKHLK